MCRVKPDIMQVFKNRFGFQLLCPNGAAEVGDRANSDTWRRGGTRTPEVGASATIVTEPAPPKGSKDDRRGPHRVGENK